MIIGYVTGSFPATPYEFHVRLKGKMGENPDFVPRVEDVVKTTFEYPGYGRITIYGIITEISAQWDGEPMEGFEEILAIEKKIKRTLRTYVAKVVVTRIISKDGSSPEVPPIPGNPVHLVSEQKEIDIALGFEDIKSRKKELPCGILKNGAMAYFDLDYVLGENGAHMNISGQSGVAAKTSYMTFLMKSLIENSRRVRKLKDAIFIVFNVKGQSLMFLDKPSLKWKMMVEDGRAKNWLSMYEKMGIKPQPFENVKFYAVSKSSVSEKPDSKRSDAIPYWWTTDEIFDLDLFESIFDPDELSRNNNLQLAVMLVSDFMNDSKENRRNIKNPSDLIEQLETEGSNLYKFLREKGELHKATIRLLKRRIQLAVKNGLDKLWRKRDSQENKVNWKDRGHVIVVDISKLRSKMQAFVVGAILKEIMSEKEGEKDNLLGVPIFIFVDELNKYAPRSEKSEIASIFRDVAERGRSFGVILVGAEQTASEVDYRVITQSSTTIVGRQKWAELQKSEYGHLLPEQKIKASTLKQGEVIVDQPFMRIPLTVEFPFPAWALNEDDVGASEEVPELL